MNRRELLKLITAATGTALIGSTGVIAGCASKEEAASSHVFSERDLRLLDEVAETILPRTDTPGAKDAEVGRFMTVFVRDCYSPEEQAIFHNGMVQLDGAANERYGAAFLELGEQQRIEFIQALDVEGITVAAAGGAPHYFTMMKQLTLFGFFTSRVGATQVLRYVAVPGRYDGCMPYEKGDRAWAT